MKLCAYLFAMVMAASAATAQERTAAGGTETQMTWSALSTQINAVNTKADGINSRVDQIIVCAKKGMLYTPGQAGADAQGCSEATKAGDLTTNLTSLSSTVNNLTSKVTNNQTCAASGKIYNGTACVAPASSGNVACTFSYTSKYLSGWPDGTNRRYYGTAALSDCAANAPDSSWMAAGYDTCSEDGSNCTPDGLLCLYAKPNCVIK